LAKWIKDKLKSAVSILRRYQSADEMTRADDLNNGLNTAQSTVGRFCPNPFQQLDVYESGDARVCCQSWLPKEIGNVGAASVAEVWNSEAAQEIRASILDGSFRYCDHRACPVIQDGRLSTLEDARKNPDFTEIIEQGKTRLDTLPGFTNLCNDLSCNLWCPSCRSERINHTEGDAFEKAKELQERIEQALFSEPTDRPFRVNVTGSGDPFASKVFRQFLYGLDGADFPNLRISLQTNGVLLTPRNWARMEKIHENIDQVIVSFDAATSETYAKTRRGGHWDTLLKNVRNLGALRQAGKLNYLRLDFVVQQANYHEIPAFVDLAESLGADHACFSLILDWGSWSRALFEVQCVWKKTHPEFDDFIQTLRHPNLGRGNVILGNLTPYYQFANELRVKVHA
jgi:sulfatase maturation enzyme AslB (radical SAM superfamily)